MNNDETTTSVVAEPWEDQDELTFMSEGEEYTVAVGDRLEHVKMTYLRTRYPAEVVRIFMEPRGLPGGSFERANGHVCVPTIEVEMDIPEDAQHTHNDGKRERWECYNAPYTLGLRDDLPEGDYSHISTHDGEEGEA
jgi:hypothetical protein